MLKADDDETPWCSSFANWCMQAAGLQGTGLALARSWTAWGIKVRPENWRFGDTAVLERPAAGPNAGHVGFLVKWDSQFVWLLGGNQGNAVSIAKYERIRLIDVRRSSLAL